jgi:hypothetical protein
LTKDLASENATLKQFEDTASKIETDRAKVLSE